MHIKYMVNNDLIFIHNFMGSFSHSVNILVRFLDGRILENLYGIYISKIYYHSEFYYNYDLRTPNLVYLWLVSPKR